MGRLQERLFAWIRDPRFAVLMKDPRAQRLVVRLFRFRGRLEGEIDRWVQRLAGHLRLATQKDLRALSRRIRELEQELREAEARISEPEGVREPRARN